MSTTVKMERDSVTADVHPEEVASWSAAGWVETKSAPRAKAARPAKAAPLSEKDGPE